MTKKKEEPESDKRLGVGAKGDPDHPELTATGRSALNVPLPVDVEPDKDTAAEERTSK